MKVKELFDIWLNKYCKLSLKIRSFNKYENFINLHINPILGEYEITDIISTNLNIIRVVMC